jgi:hypothetical protein
LDGRRLLAVICLLALGCSSGEKPRVPVSGRVLYKGYAVRSGKIAFTPDKERGTQGSIVNANLSPDGSFRLGDGGLPPGFYRLTIASLEVSLPGKYRDPTLANLVREVVAGKENTFDILLDD